MTHAGKVLLHYEKTGFASLRLPHPWRVSLVPNPFAQGKALVYFHVPVRQQASLHELEHKNSTRLASSAEWIVTPTESLFYGKL